MSDAAEPIAYTYEDAGQLCGVSAETIRARARRGKLRRGRPTNSGRPTVLLTAAEVAAVSAGRPFRGVDGQPPGRPDERPSGQSPGQAAIVEALTAHIATLREHLARIEAAAGAAQQTVEQERDRERARAEAAEARAERGEATAAAERAAAAEERARLLAQLDRLTAELAALRAQPVPPPRGWLSWLLRRPVGSMSAKA
jgi:hypothetical protein